jgi:hypothetical protein
MPATSVGEGIDANNRMPRFSPARWSQLDELLGPAITLTETLVFDLLAGRHALCIGVSPLDLSVLRLTAGHQRVAVRADEDRLYCLAEPKRLDHSDFARSVALVVPGLERFPLGE